jgi:hypothetical protein
MKKYLILMMLAFSVIVYASPPVPDFCAKQICLSPPGNFETIQSLEVQ